MSSQLGLRSAAPWQVLDGFGRAVQRASRIATPHSVDELRSVMLHAAAEDLRVTFRGAGRSYGDASLATGGVVVDTSALRRIIRWDPKTGVFEGEPGVTIEQLWRHTLGDGYWPAVVPGTMRPTLGGCVAMNIHGKNNFRTGGFGDQVQEIDLLTADGMVRALSRDQDPELFRAVVGGLGLLGAITRVKLQLKKVESGKLRVRALVGHSLMEMFDIFEQNVATADYLVGWLDSFAEGQSLGRGQVHVANYLHRDEDPDWEQSLRVDRQDLPSSIMGVPKKHLWRIMRPFMRDPFVRLVNWAKHLMSRWDDGDTYLQSHVAFAFLLDYVPDWRLAYGSAGFIQYQVFVPDLGARDCLSDVLKICQREGFVSYLSVLKRHRPDEFLLTHALDGWSLAMDFPVRDVNEADWRCRVERATHALTERVLAAGGRFYFAKDAVLRASDVQRAFGPERLARFDALRRQVDPQRRLSSALAERVLASANTGTNTRT